MCVSVCFWYKPRTCNKKEQWVPSYCLLFSNVVSCKTCTNQVGDAKILSIQSFQKEPTVDASYAEQILGMFTDTLMRSKVKVDGNEQRVHNCISFICDVATNFFSAVKVSIVLSVPDRSFT